MDYNTEEHFNFANDINLFQTSRLLYSSDLENIKYFTTTLDKASVCVLQVNKRYRKWDYTDNKGFYDTFTHASVCAIQKNTKYRFITYITSQPIQDLKLVDIELHQVNTKLKQTRYVVLQFTDVFDLTELKPKQSTKYFIEKKYDTTMLFSTYNVKSIYLKQQRTKSASSKINYEHIKPGICVLGSNKLFTTITYTGAPNKYLLDGVISATDCNYDAKTSIILKKYNYKIDLNNTLYDINLPFSIDFDDSTIDMTEATIDISF